MPKQCILIFGGSFDPVHCGHIELARHFYNCFNADKLRLIPAGNPWQKEPLSASAENRIAMLELAFAETGMIFCIDQQEIHRAGPSYSVETLSKVRSELGDQVSLVFILGADQLINLQSWHRWKDLFDYAHVAVASRPDFDTDTVKPDHEVMQFFKARLASPQAIHDSASGKSYFSPGLNLPVSATEIRKAIQYGELDQAVVPSKVLDYIQDHHLYRH